MSKPLFAVCLRPYANPRTLQCFGWCGFRRLFALLLISAWWSSCALYNPPPPSQPKNVCEVFRENRGWYQAARKASKRWQTPIATNMAFIYHESGYRARVRPPRRDGFLFFPGPRLSDAYGYAQVKNATWRWYQDKTGRHRAERHSFADAIDFVAWYNYQSGRINGVPSSSARDLYLNYHEGHTGFKRGSYRSKPQLLKIASRVSTTADNYQQQLAGCEKSLRRKFLGLF